MPSFVDTNVLVYAEDRDAKRKHEIASEPGGLLIEAMRLQQKAQLSFWDALVVQAAVHAGCDKLYSEDLNAGQRFGSVLVINPFKPARPSAPG